MTTRGLKPRRPQRRQQRRIPKPEQSTILERLRTDGMLKLTRRKPSRPAALKLPVSVMQLQTLSGEISAELEAMGACIAALSGLPNPAKVRVLGWVKARLGMEKSA